MMPSQPCLLDQVRTVLRRRNDAMWMEEATVEWIKQYILFSSPPPPIQYGYR